MKPLSSFSRRNFLRTLAATGLASGSAFAAPSPTAQPFNEVHDLVIVGSGFAGL
ncbi:MAG TPA: flavocytochrome c, partial [Sutterellaceae bacterium]|nr:flavocytochrome c [Sutterellaceae bacterium]